MSRSFRRFAGNGSGAWIVAAGSVLLACNPLVASSAPVVSSLSLFDSKTGTVISSSLASNAVISVSGLSTKCLNIRANADSSTQSVKFAYDGKSPFSVENGSPYAIMGDTGSRGCIVVGSHTIAAWPYTQDNASGTAGAVFYRAFTVKEASTPTPTPTATPAATPVTTTLIPKGATWRYLDNGSDQGKTWRLPSFSDGAWKSGPGPFGYGYSTGLKTVVGYGPSSGKYVTTYFRIRFNVADPAAFKILRLSSMRRNGIVVYLNGGEITRPGMNPHSEILYTTRSSGTFSEFEYLEQFISPNLLVAGTNTLTVEAHRREYTDGGMTFDLSLIGDTRAVLPLGGQTGTAVQSQLWGAAGEKWSPTSRLPDFSFAGYHMGEATIPPGLPVTSVKDHKAVGDGKTDDTAAFKAAIASVTKGVISIPAGTYLLSDVIYITKPGIVLRGAGPGKTVLKFNTDLTHMPGAGQKCMTTERDAEGNCTWSQYSYIGGAIWARGTDLNGALVGDVKYAAKRGDVDLTLSAIGTLKEGSVVRVNLTNPKDGASANLLAKDLLNGLVAPSTSKLGATLVKHTSRITAISGTKITLERPLPVDVKLEYLPKVYLFRSDVQEVGVEDLEIRFPSREYPGHFSETGYNGIAFEKVAHSWIKNVRIHNSENGVNVHGSQFNTVTGVAITADPLRPDKVGLTAHHGINLSGSFDNVVTGFEILTKTAHDAGLDGNAGQNVYENGYGVDLCMDHHGNGVWQNLYTNIHLGAGARAFLSGGATDALPHASSYETFWNIRASQPVALPKKGSDTVKPFGPRLNLIGLPTSDTALPSGYEWQLEAPLGSYVTPANLYRGQLQKRGK